ncbi:MAG: hypothetical protein ACXABY_04230 [Candidatus Thorarchaeota archaeon]|jgi:hypothetical protein
MGEMIGFIILGTGLLFIGVSLSIAHNRLSMLVERIDKVEKEMVKLAMKQLEVEVDEKIKDEAPSPPTDRDKLIMEMSEKIDQMTKAVKRIV